MLNFKEFAAEVCGVIIDKYEKDAMYIETNKNGVIFHGITIGNGEVRPTMYLNTYSEDIQRGLVNPEEVADRIMSELMNHELPEFDLNKTLFDEKFVKDHIQLCVRNSSIKNTPGDEILTKQVRDWDLDAYLRVVLNTPCAGQASVSIKDSMISALDEKGITFRKMIRWAKKNAVRDYELRSMLDVLGDMGAPQLFAPNNYPLYVLSSKQQAFGAGVIADDGVLDEVCKELNSMELVIIPSSIHETIIIPKDRVTDMASLEELATVIKEVNSAELAPEDILSDHAYTYVANID